MINNIDTNVGKLLDQLKQWNIERDTLVIFMTDNGSAAGSKVYSAGMRGAKGTPYLGGTRVPGFWRWPGKFSADRDVKQFTCHWDILPTIMEIVGIKPDDQLKSQIEGRSFLPLLVSKPSNDATVAWPDRDFITHVGRWQNGAMEQGKYANGAIRRGNWHLVFKNKNNFELFDLSRDYAETTNVAKDHPELVKDLTMAFDAWWDSAKTSLVNEDVPIPSINPYKAWYWKQYRGPGPNNAPPPADFVFE